MNLVVTGVDLETTGFNADKGDRITEVAMLVYILNTDTMLLTPKGKLSTLVNPMRNIPLEVQKITHITPALVKDAPTWAEVGPKFSKVMCMTDIFVAHNADFDFIFAVLELHRLGLNINENMEVFCTMENGRFATPMGKCPKLTELCWALDVGFDDKAAHRAIYDTSMMMKAFDVGLKRGYFNLNETIEKVRMAKKIADAA